MYIIINYKLFKKINSYFELKNVPIVPKLLQTVHRYVHSISLIYQL